MKAVPSIEINLDSVKQGLKLFIDSRGKDNLFDAEKSALENNEARFQLLEGCYYDYQLSDSSYILGNIGENIIQHHKRNTHIGSLAPNIFVGTLCIPIIDKGSGEEKGKIELEVQSIKAGYRNDYRDMLEWITEKCTDLLLLATSPVSQHFDIDHFQNSKTLYQRFVFIKSVIGSEEFAEAVHRIVTAPVTRWTETFESKDIRKAKRFSNANTKEFLKGSKRTKWPESLYLENYGLKTLPERITSIRKTDSVDTPENRFIKHALESFLKLCTDLLQKSKEFGYKKMKKESEILIQEIEGQLHHSVFKEISKATTLKLNSPVLQRKEGYREVLRVWLMFDLAAKLIWSGGDDVYSGGKKDVATLYEYWLFFKLLELLEETFQIEPKDISELIKETSDGLNLQIRQGKFTALSGVYDSGTRKLNVRFSYNRSFSARNGYPEGGSWTTTLRPDYTLSFWPFGISESDAERQELIVHVHFDAKYKVANLTAFLEQKTETDLEAEKVENKKGIYKNADLLKMHAYKDAIRRTGGAYILYPGDKSINRKGFHEIIPGLGAFPVKPSKTDSGIGELKAFIIEIVEHFINRTTQREKLAYRVFDVYKNPPDPENAVREAMPEPYNANRDMIPDDTYILVGFFNSPEHLEWINRNQVYNFRMGSDKGSLILDKEKVSSKYLLLHTSGDKCSGKIWRIVSKGPKVFSKHDLLRMNYPSDPKDNYLVIELAPVTEPEFQNVRWDFRKLEKYSSRRDSGLPFTTTLAELMKNKVP